jgi:hypothetical protein
MQLLLAIFLIFSTAAFASSSPYGPNACAYWTVRLEEIALWEEELIRAREDGDEKLIQYFKLKIWEAMEAISKDGERQ